MGSSGVAFHAMESRKQAEAFIPEAVLSFVIIQIAIYLANTLFRVYLGKVCQKVDFSFSFIN